MNFEFTKISLVAYLFCSIYSISQLPNLTSYSGTYSPTYLVPFYLVVCMRRVHGKVASDMSGAMGLTSQRSIGKSSQVLETPLLKYSPTVGSELK